MRHTRQITHTRRLALLLPAISNNKRFLRRRRSRRRTLTVSRLDLRPENRVDVSVYDASRLELPRGIHIQSTKPTVGDHEQQGVISIGTGNTGSRQPPALDRQCRRTSTHVDTW